MKKKSERVEALFRVIVLIVSGIILYLWAYLSYILIFVNWLVALFAGFRSKPIAEFVEYWNSSLYGFFRYLSGLTNERPFPFTNLKRLSGFKK